ncbi:DUF4097 family beta strand repeat-containing protein [Pseudonocardia humida]|uniref:DUF4097 family beta strand repeat protein n=1 Tax=Pseudonocardia humida TaxID=2800819 RepID=A0ABT1A508_9PSEU|nr:DUF4097 family beta strand repeat-containing protein [Pseudonocardia humida]MCO1658091.1 DUF4097 family beta strand repeat protein [Pseudonocardia humida]
MSESASRRPGSRSAQFRLVPLLALAAAAVALTGCGQAPAPQQVEPAGVTFPDTGSTSGLSTSDEGSDVEDPVDVEDAEDGGGSVVVGSRPGEPAPTEVTTEQITGPVAVLEVSTDAGRVSVIGSDDPAVTVTRRIHREPDAPVEAVRHDGDVLRIESECPVDSPRGPCRIDYEIAVPRDTSVAIGGAGGDLATTGLAGPLTARSASGSILVAEHRSPTTVADTASGDVEVRLGERPVSLEVRSVSGNVRVVLPDAGSYRVETATVSGDTDVDVRDDPGASSTVRARTTSGDVTVGTS